MQELNSIRTKFEPDENEWLLFDDKNFVAIHDEIKKVIKTDLKQMEIQLLSKKISKQKFKKRGKPKAKAAKTCEEDEYENLEDNMDIGERLKKLLFELDDLDEFKLTKKTTMSTRDDCQTKDGDRDSVDEDKKSTIFCLEEYFNRDEVESFSQDRFEATSLFGDNDQCEELGYVIFNEPRDYDLDGTKYTIDDSYSLLDESSCMDMDYFYCETMF